MFRTAMHQVLSILIFLRLRTDIHAVEEFLFRCNLSRRKTLVRSRNECFKQLDDADMWTILTVYDRVRCYLPKLQSGRSEVRFSKYIT